MNFDAKMRQARKVRRGQQRGDGKGGRGGRGDASSPRLAETAGRRGTAVSMSLTRTVSPIRIVSSVDPAVLLRASEGVVSVDASKDSLSSKTP